MGTSPFPTEFDTLFGSVAQGIFTVSPVFPASIAACLLPLYQAIFRHLIFPLISERFKTAAASVPQSTQEAPP